MSQPGPVDALLATRREFLRRATLALSALAFAGCSAPRQLTDPVIGPSYIPGNYFRKSDTLPPKFRRVALLPLSWSPGMQHGPAAAESLEPILNSELAKTNKFELLKIRPEDLKQWTGKAVWNFQESLPQHFLTKLEENTACDGVLFSHVTRFHPYPPLVTGWRLHLVTIKEGDVLWSVDEVFDAGETSVSNAARRYSKEHIRNHPTLEDSRSILLSPSRFGQYTASEIMKTLPAR